MVTRGRFGPFPNGRPVGRLPRLAYSAVLFNLGWFTTQMRYFVACVDQREAPGQGGGRRNLRTRPKKPRRSAKVNKQRHADDLTNNKRRTQPPKQQTKPPRRRPTPARGATQRANKNKSAAHGQCKRRGPSPDANQRKG